MNKIGLLSAIASEIVEASRLRRRMVAEKVARRRLRRSVFEKASLRQYERVEREITRALVPVFEDQLRSMEAKLREMGEEKAVNPAPSQATSLARLIFTPREWDDEIRDAVLPILAKNMVEAAVDHLLSIGVDVRMERKKTVKHGDHDQSTHGRGGGGGGKFSDEENAFGDWEAPTSRDLPEDAVNGYRGTGSGGSFGNSEGDGLYLAKTSETAGFFGKPKRVAFLPPKNPLLIDEEPLYILWEMDDLEEPLAGSDSDWLSASKEAFQQSRDAVGRYDPDDIGHRLTDILKDRGHDGIRVRSGGEEWVVLYDNAPKIEVEPERRRSVHREKATTATEWIEENAEDWASLIQLVEEAGLSIRLMTEIPPWMQTAIAEHLAETFDQDYWQAVSEATLGDAERYLSRGLREGWSIDKMARNMREHFMGGGLRYARARSEAIARTESGHALNSARKESVAQLQRDLGPQVPMKQSWLSVLGNTTRDDHAALDGVPEDENGLWNLVGFMVPWPAHYSLPAEQRINCQCSLTIEFGMNDDEALALIEEHQERQIEIEENR